MNSNFTDHYIAQNDLSDNMSGFENNYHDLRSQITTFMSPRAGCWAASGMTYMLRHTNKKEEEILNKILNIRQNSNNNRETGEEYNKLLSAFNIHYNQLPSTYTLRTVFQDLPSRCVGLIKKTPSNSNPIKHTLFFYKHNGLNKYTIWNPWNDGTLENHNNIDNIDNSSGAMYKAVYTDL